MSFCIVKIAFYLFISSFVCVNGAYRIPKPTIKELSPRGFRVSIPGMVFFGFYFIDLVNKNKISLLLLFIYDLCKMNEECHFLHSMEV